MSNYEKAGEQFKEKPNVELERGLTPEYLEAFETLLENSSKGMLDPGWEHQGSWKDFVVWWCGNSLGGKKPFLEARRTWFEMKRSGDLFEKFFQAKIREKLDEGQNSLVYIYVIIYEALGYKERIKFLGEVLGHKTVWTDWDGSTSHQILEFFEKSQSPAATDAILLFIEHALSDYYQRKAYMHFDLDYATSALKASIGDKAKELLESLAEKDPTFRGWFEKSKLSVLSEKALTAPKKIEFDEFDVEKERKRLKLLELEYDELRQNPPPKIEWSPDLNPFLDPFEPVEEKGGEKELPILLHKEVQSTEGVFGPWRLELEAERWERDQLLNFYGRFRPKLEKGIELTSENYLTGLWATVRHPEREDCLNFFSGVMREEFGKTETPSRPDIKDAYGMASLAFGRALSIGVLENRIDEAIAEINTMRDFLGGQAEKLENQKDISFLLSLSHQLSQAQGYLADNKEALSKLSLPESADSFFIYHSKLKKAREIPDFRTLLAEKIRWYLATDLSYNLERIEFDQLQMGNVWVPEQGPAFRRLEQIIKEYHEGFRLYRSVEEKDIPLYWEAQEKLGDTEAKRVVVFGRDGRYFFSALKTSEFGKKKREIKYVVVTTAMNDPIHENKVVQYLRQKGVSLDFTFIDTGFRGSVPEFAIRFLANAEGVRLSAKAVDERIKLLASSIGERGELSRKRRSRGEQESSISVIEDRPKNIERPVRLIIDERGKAVPEEVPAPVRMQLMAWVVEHATMRNFAPRLDADKRIRYLRKNTLEGYKFIQEYHGSHIGTHPMQLWEGKEGKKILLKGGPIHTLRADFVGQKFLRLAGFKVPDTELVTTDEGKKLKIEFLEEWQVGGIKLSREHHKNPEIQKALLIDCLLGQYDRTPWNLMFKGREVAFIDNGASLTSRARGGHKGFSERFGIEELQEVLSNPQFPGEPVNDAYHNFIKITGGRIEVSDKALLREMLTRLSNITDDDSDRIIEQAEFLDGERSIKDLRSRIEKLKSELDNLPPASSDFQKTAAAIKTYQRAIEAGGEAAYLKQVLRKRRDDIVFLFEPLSRANSY